MLLRAHTHTHTDKWIGISISKSNNKLLVKDLGQWNRVFVLLTADVAVRAVTWPRVSKQVSKGRAVCSREWQAWLAALCLHSFFGLSYA